MAIEAYVNLLGAHAFGADEYIKWDRENKCNKLKDRLKEFCHKIYQREFPTGGKLYENIDGLFKDRDRLVHYKSIGISEEKLMLEKNQDKESDQRFAEYMHSSYNFIYKKLENRIGLYNELRTLFRGFDNENKDVLDKEYKKFGKAIYESIDDCFKKIVFQSRQ